jgi:hypothetical protein
MIVSKSMPCSFLMIGAFHSSSTSSKEFYHRLTEQQAILRNCLPYILWKRVCCFRKSFSNYCWPTMNEDMADFAKSCRTYQVQTNLIHTHPISLQNMVTPWPLHTWGLDLSGPVNPPSGRDNWILEPTDYFSKWVEAIPFRKATGTVVANFIHKHIITRSNLKSNRELLTHREVQCIICCRFYNRHNMS